MPIYVFGSNSISQLGLGEDADSTHIPTLLPFFNDKKVKKIKCGTIHTLVLTTDNKLYSWGCNDEYALGREGDESIPMEVDLKDEILDMTGGASISACITKKGDLYIWGTFRNSSGVFGIDKYTRIQKKPRKFKSNLNGFKFIDIDSGSNFICLLSKTKNIWTFGSNEFYELCRRTSTRDRTSSLFPHPIFSGKARIENHKFQAVRCGSNHGAGINTNNEVYIWGSNIYGQLGIGHCEETKLKHKVDLKNVVDVSGGEHHTLFLTDDHKCYGCGRNDQSQLGIEKDKIILKPKLIIENVQKIRTYENFSILQIDDKLFSFGLCYSGATGFEETIVSKPKLIPFDFKKIIDFRVGADFTIVLTE